MIHPEWELFHPHPSGTFYNNGQKSKQIKIWKPILGLCTKTSQKNNYSVCTFQVTIELDIKLGIGYY